jgi:hypothetical protein
MDFTKEETYLFDDGGWVAVQLVQYLGWREKRDQEIMPALLKASTFDELCKDIRDFKDKEKEAPVIEELSKTFEQYYQLKTKKQSDIVKKSAKRLKDIKGDGGEIETIQEDIRSLN